MKVGIVGTGIAGLTAGWLCEQAGHEVLLFEKLSSLGMAAHTLKIENGQNPGAIDIPPRMFNSAQWPTLVRLYDCIGVEYEPVDLSKSYSRLGGKSFLNLNSSFRPQAGFSMLRKNVRQIVADASKMMNQISDLDEAGNGLTFREYLDVNQFSDPFIFEFLYPSLSSTICTCSYRSLDSYPASLILRSLVDIIGPDLSQSRSLMKTRLGSEEVAKQLSKDVAHVLCSTTVVSVESDSTQLRVIYKKGDRLSETSFDHLLVATQANQSAQFLPGLSEMERSVLDSVKYESIETLVHSDESLMPTDRSNWAHFNFVIGADASMCNVWMNQFNHETLLGKNVFQTIGPIDGVIPQELLGRKILQRPVVTRDSKNTWNTIAEFHRQPDRRIWFCGSYASSGIPLLESGVVSSLNVVASMGIEIPESISPLPA